MRVDGQWRMGRTLGLVCGLIALGGLVSGCKPDKPEAEKGNEARARVTEHGVQADEARRSQGGEKLGTESKGLTEAEKKLPVATIGDYTITLGDVENALARQPAFARSRYRSFDKKVAFVENLINFELLAIEAQRKGYDTHPDVVLAMKREMIKKFSATDLQQLVTVSKIGDAEIQRFYDNNKSMFVKPAQVRASHILFEDETSAKKAHAEIAAAIKADKERSRVIFSDFARRLSKDQSTAHLNGDLNFFTKEGYLDKARSDAIKLPAPLVKAAFNLAGLNRVTDVIKTEQGWHLVQVTNRRPAVNRTVDDAKRQITNLLLREKKDGARDAYIQSLRKKASVSIDKKALEKLDVSAIGKKKSQAPDMANPVKALKLPPKAPSVPPKAPTAPPQPTQKEGTSP